MSDKLEQALNEAYGTVFSGGLQKALHHIVALKFLYGSGATDDDNRVKNTQAQIKKALMGEDK